MAAAVTRAQARKHENPKLLKEMTAKIAMEKEELVRLQKKDSTMQKFKKQKKQRQERVYRTAYEMRGEI